MCARRVTFRDLCAENEHDLRKLNSVIFPVRYVVRVRPRVRAHVARAWCARTNFLLHCGGAAPSSRSTHRARARG